MNPFINLTNSSRYGGGSEKYSVNVNHIVRIARSSSGSQIVTLSGDFACDETPAQVDLMINNVFAQQTRVISDN